MKIGLGSVVLGAAVAAVCMSGAGDASRAAGRCVEIARVSTPSPVRLPAQGGPGAGLVLAGTAKELGLTKGLAVGLIGIYGRSAVPTDLLAWQMAMGTMAAPDEGVIVGKNDKGQEQAWAAVEAGAEGWIENRALSGGYLYIVVNSALPRTMILEATGYYVGWVNGDPRGGEKYGADWVRHPVRLRVGRNEFLFRGERGRFRGRLFEPPAEMFFTDKDMTLPDLVIGEREPVRAGLRLINATGERLEKIEILWRADGRDGRAGLDVSIAPLLAQKLAVPLSVDAPSAEGAVKVEIRARARAGRRTVETPPFMLELKAVPASAHHSRTFVSEVDRSVQYFGVAPMVRDEQTHVPRSSGSKPALVLSLHGAGVEAIGQARAYKPKDWAYVVAATNRRPYGFDWEDWGRLDALEVLAEASRIFGTDSARTYLTGHSMGGHGAWQVGATVPGLWAAVAPSAGWHSFTSYGGGVVYKDPSPVEKMLVRANNPSETTGLARNFLHYGVYILHGDQDDNVPVTQARFMRELLGKFHPDFSYYERPGAGHWWGNECVDWPPLFEFLKARVRPQYADVKRVEFVTANPGISSRSRWVEILAQTRPLEYSKVVIDKDETGKAFKGTTENVARLAIDVPTVTAGGAVTIELDGFKLEAAPASGMGRICLERGEKGWAATGPPTPGSKGPHRSDGFKDAFRHGFIFVYGTRGDAAEDVRSFGKARFDAEMFWVRGNAGIDVLPDTAFDPVRFKDRSVILYGNADTNTAWPKLLVGCPVEVRNGWARAGEKRYTGSDLAAYFVRPRPGSDIASVGVVAWSGPAGWVAASPGQYFISGAGFPDLLLFSAETLRSGTDGVRAIGWFGNDWGLDTGDIVWNDGRRYESGDEVIESLRPQQETSPAPAVFDPQKTYPAEALKGDLNVLWDMLEEGHGGGRDEYGKLLFAHVMDRPFLYYWALETKKDNYDLFQYTDETAKGREELAKQVKKNARGWYDVLGHPNVGLQQPQEPRFTGRVAILIDGGSFSATGETTSLFHYYKKAAFFGEECSSGYYGNTSGFMVMATLPNTRLQVRIPLILYTMAVDNYPKDRGIVPDLSVTPTIEDLLAGRDPVMEKALLFLVKK
jgi:poly(3-hydroxybutyrate) depolymerase